MKVKNKSQYIVILALLMVIMLPMFLVHTFAVDTNSNDETIVSEEKIVQVPYAMGVNRSRESNIAQQNIEIFQNEFVSFFKVFFVFLVFIAIVFTGIVTVLKNQDAKTRAEYIDRFKNIIFGVILFSLIGVILNFALKYQNDAFYSLYDGSLDNPESITLIEDEVESGLGSAIFGPIKSFLNIVDWGIEKLLVIILRALSGSLFGSTSVEFTINDAVFLNHLGSLIRFDAESHGIRITSAPFTIAEWDKYTLVYRALSTLFIPLMLIALVKTSYELVICSGNFEKVEEAKKTILRIVVSIALIVIGPYLFRLVLTVFNMLVFLIPANFYDFTDQMPERIGLFGLAMKVWMLCIKFKIVLAMLVREIMLTVMYLATPLMIGIWTISDKFKSVQLWMGETLSNAATQFCYAFVLYLAGMVVHVGQKNLFFILIWYSMMIKVADFFKDSLQGVISRWGGINESGIVDSTMKQAQSWGKTFYNKTLSFIDDDNIQTSTRLFRNMGAAVTFLTTGDSSEFISRGKAIRKYGKTLIGKGNEFMSINNNLRRSGAVKEAINASRGAAHLEDLYQTYFAASGDEKKNLKAQINEFYNANKGDSSVETIHLANESKDQANEAYSLGISLDQRGKFMYKKQEFVQGLLNARTDKMEDEFKNYVNVYGTQQKGHQYRLSKAQRELIKNANIANDMPGNTDYESNLRDVVKVRGIDRRAVEDERKLMTAAIQNKIPYGNDYISRNFIKYDKYNVKSDPDALYGAMKNYAASNGISPTELKNNANEIRERYQVAKATEIANLRKQVADTIARQHNGQSNGITDDAKRANMSRTNSTVKSFVDYMYDLNKSKLLLKNDSIAEDLNKFIEEVAINGDIDLANELKAKAKVYNTK